MLESVHAGGSAWFVFGILPELNVIHGAMISNCLFVVPSILQVKHWRSSENRFFDPESIIRLITLLFQVRFDFKLILTEKVAKESTTHF